MIIAERKGVLLRHATDADLPRVDEITIMCYAPIIASFVEIVGEDCVQGIYGDPDFDWRARKTKQVRDLYQEHPDHVWVLEEAGQLFGSVTGVGHVHVPASSLALQGTKNSVCVRRNRSG